MRYIFFLLTAIAITQFSCKKNTPATAIPSGTYKGTFKRSFIPGVSNVTLTFSINKFEGQSEILHYPDICNGSFVISKDTVSFENGCAFTADFDWSYILSGKFKFSVLGDSLILTRKYNGIVYYYDTYKLKKQ